MSLLKFNPLLFSARTGEEAGNVNKRYVDFIVDAVSNSLNNINNFLDGLYPFINNLIKESSTVDRKELVTSTKWSTNAPLQFALKNKAIIQWVPGATTTASIGYGAVWTVAATQAHPNSTTTNLLTSLNRATFATTTTSGNAAGIRTSVSKLLTGENGFGGFYYFSRFGFVAIHADMQFMNGVTESAVLLAANPSTLNNTICIGKDQADTTLQIILKGTGDVHKINLGISPVANDVFTVEFFSPPTERIVYYKVVRENNKSIVAEGSYTGASLPVASTPMLIHSEIRTNAVAAVTFALQSIYTETDL
jgi:hypothetical protein